MANMSYCRFRNTLRDLRDCYEAMEQLTFEHGSLDGESIVDDLSDDELQAMQSILEVAENMIREFTEG